MNSFKILKKDKRTKARLGVLETLHGTVKTPAYVFVGTYGGIRHLSPADIKKTKAQIIIANTFHLWQTVLKTKNSKLKIKNFGSFIHNKFGMKLPIMTDSGGFQVLSLAFGDKDKVGKFMTGEVKADDSFKRTKIRITDKGVHFLFNPPSPKLQAGKRQKWMFLGPELSMKLQRKIGADIIFAFDHITSPLDTYAYNKKALELTNKWARICLKTRSPKQALFGIVQGGLFKDLRIKSAKSIGSMPFDGFGIGGSYTKKQIAKVLKWIVPYLPEEKPRHLLGVGKVEDIFEAVENGIDTFDCVIPTREARHGRLYTKTGHLDIRRGYYTKDKKVIEPGCKCPTCSGKVSRAKIRELLKSDQPARQAQSQRYALMHNMWFFNKLLEDMRNSIAKDKFKEFKKKFLTDFKS